MSSRLEGKTALITGASQGIGQAIATLYAQNGATVILSDIQDAKGEGIAQEIGANASYVHLVVSNEANWQKVMADISSLDILVNNAGITGFMETSGPHDPEDLDMESFNKVNSVNVDGVVLGCKYAIKKMKDKGGSIVNISSRSGMVGIPGAAAYASSKAAVRNHTKTVALYCASKKYPVRCNSIHPAAILTPIWDPMLGEGEARVKAIEAIASDIPLGRIGVPDDVAYAAIYLGSDEANYLTGSELTIDGGILAGDMAPL